MWGGDAEVGQEWGLSLSEGQAGLDKNRPKRASMVTRPGDSAARGLPVMAGPVQREEQRL